MKKNARYSVLFCLTGFQNLEKRLFVPIRFCLTKQPRLVQMKGDEKKHNIPESLHVSSFSSLK